MSSKPFHLESAPIVEVILDIDCDLPPAFQLDAAEAEIHATVRDAYPKMRRQLIQEHKFSLQGDAPPDFCVRRGLQALQCLTSDEKQIIQFRAAGFSFNRLAPYSRLDDYLPEIHRSWELFRGIAKPVLIRKIGLRTINKIPLPLVEGKVKLEDYIETCPRLPDEDSLTFLGFLNHHMAAEPSTGNRVNIVLMTMEPEPAHLPLILDIDAFRAGQIDPSSWPGMLEILMSIRDLKNRVFRNSLTEKCLSLFSPSV
jgi:uncharacterized protein (TIGR04255 family)